MMRKYLCLTLACVLTLAFLGPSRAENDTRQSMTECQKRLDAILEWRRDHPEGDWVEREKSTHTITPPADNSDLLSKEDQGDSHVYGKITSKDLVIWDRELEKLVVDGSRIFHSSDELGSTIAVSCDMCHPDASNTHPETYPKFQPETGSVALLRDMINWCLVQAVRADRLAADDPKMRALEAYILAQRKGKAMNYGKH